MSGDDLPSGTRSQRRMVRAPVVALAALSLTLAGCGSGSEGSDPECQDVRSSVDRLAEEITALGAEVQVGTAPDETLQQQERRWAELVLGDRSCFSAERVAVALTVLQALDG